MTPQNDTLNEFIEAVKNNTLIVSVEYEASSYTKLNLFSFDRSSNQVKELAHPDFEFVGDMNGIIMPHIQRLPKEKGGWDVGPRYPTVKLLIRESDELFKVFIHFNRAIHLGYYATVVKKYVEENKLKWKSGFEFYGFLPNNSLDSDEHFMGATVASSNGTDVDLASSIQFPAKGSITKDKFQKSLKFAFGSVSGAEGLTLRRERSIVYENARRGGAKEIYLATKILHKDYPNGQNKYRSAEQEPTPEMLKASNWGIFIPLLAWRGEGKERRIIKPTQNENWVDHPELGFKEVINEREPNYFLGKSIFKCEKTSHSRIESNLSAPIDLKFNMNCVSKIWKIPGEPAVTKNKDMSGGYEEVDVNMNDIISMHKRGTVPVKEKNSTSVVTFETGTTNPFEKTSPSKDLKNDFVEEED